MVYVWSVWNLGMDILVDEKINMRCMMWAGRGFEGVMSWSGKKMFWE